EQDGAPLEIIDLSSLDGEVRRPSVVLGMLHAVRARAFSPDVARPARCLAFVSSSTETFLGLIFDHVALDGWSHSGVVDELVRGYRGEDVGPRPPPLREAVLRQRRARPPWAGDHFRALTRGLAVPTPIGVVAAAAGGGIGCVRGTLPTHGVAEHARRMGVTTA